jgi:2-polyprenyl-3-methyl-5-hydroxy-6-metoxy-1,4-benzoquinol methylase
MKVATADQYTRDYYLGAIDAETGKRYGAAGAEAFKGGKVDGRYMRFLRTLPLKGKDVLDVGCGRGDILRACCGKVRSALGIDYSFSACVLAISATSGHEEIDIRCKSILDMETPKQFDIIFLLDVIEHIPQKDMAKVYWMVYRSLRGDGVLILDTPMYKSPDDKDSSDTIPATQGMHCNKQTKDSLYLDLWARGFKKYSHNVWYKGRFSFRMWLYAKSIWPQTLLWKVGQVLK